MRYAVVALVFSVAACARGTAYRAHEGIHGGPSLSAGAYRLVVTAATTCGFPEDDSGAWSVAVSSPPADTREWWQLLDELHLDYRPGAVIRAESASTVLLVALDHEQPGGPYRAMAGLLLIWSPAGEVADGVQVNGHLEGEAVRAFDTASLGGSFRGAVRGCEALDHRWRIEPAMPG